MKCRYCTNRIKHTHDQEYIRSVTKPPAAPDVSATPIRELKVVKNDNGLLLKFADGGMNTIADFRDYAGIEAHAENIVRAVNAHEGLIKRLNGLVSTLKSVRANYDRPKKALDGSWYAFDQMVSDEITQTLKAIAHAEGK